jgi:hypothetical protein
MEIIYNVTVSLEPTIEQTWLDWMCKSHIPDVISTNCFKEARISKLNNEENDACTYAITYVAYSEKHLTNYQHEHAPRLQKDHSRLFEGKFAAFRTTLSVIKHFTNEQL